MLPTGGEGLFIFNARDIDRNLGMQGISASALAYSIFEHQRSVRYFSDMPSAWFNPSCLIVTISVIMQMLMTVISVCV